MQNFFQETSVILILFITFGYFDLSEILKFILALSHKNLFLYF